MEARIERLEERVTQLEHSHKLLDERQRIVEREQAETRVYVKQILERIDDLKMMISQKPSTSENTKDWLSFARWIIGATIVAIVAYIFGGGMH